MNKGHLLAAATPERADEVLERLGDWLEDGGERLWHGPRGGGPFGG